jgi:hypothetical protein
MDRAHTLVGEEFFRDMMHLEDERRRLLGSNQRNVTSSAKPSNVVSLEDYRRQHLVGELIER